MPFSAQYRFREAKSITIVHISVKANNTSVGYKIRDDNAL